MSDLELARYAVRKLGIPRILVKAAILDHCLGELVYVAQADEISPEGHERLTSAQEITC